VTGISMPNTGSASRMEILSTKVENCTTDINIAHPSGSGLFQGAIDDNPAIIVNPSSSFGVSYLDSLQGNKRIIYFDAASFNLVAGATPTTTAATRGTLTATGFSLVTFGGATNSDAGCSVNFRIPPDYFQNGKFKIVWTSETGAGNIKWQFIVTKKATGQNLATTTETGLSLTVASTTAYNVQESAFINSTTTYTAGDTVSIRVYRLGNDAADTLNASAYISGLLFQYESTK
jgi:hypothetical protein